MTSAPAQPGTLPALLNRERAILAFNRRVLAQARRTDVPLLERLRYITIVSSNMDEFFEVRFADAIGSMRLAMNSPGAGTPSSQYWKNRPTRSPQPDRSVAAEHSIHSCLLGRSSVAVFCDRVCSMAPACHAVVTAGLISGIDRNRRKYRG